MDLVFGAHAVQSSEPTQLRVRSESIINHPNYQPVGLRNDVALIRIPTAITTNINIQIITLAPASASTYEGSNALLTGWGRISDSTSSISSVLKGVIVDVITNAVCSISYGTTIQPNNICTSGNGEFVSSYLTYILGSF